MKKIISFLIFIFIIQLSLGQEYQAKIASVADNGLYKIELTPEIRSASSNNLQFLRILNNQKKEIPYLIFNEEPDNIQFEILPLKSKEAIKNLTSTVVFINEKNQNIDGVILEIANTDVTKNYRISGSNDDLQWFGLVNNQRVSNLKDLQNTSVERLFTFPLNKYKYLKFEFIDEKSLPINVVSAKIKISNPTKKRQINLTDFEQSISVDKQNKQTKIKIRFATPQVIDGVKFKVSSPDFFLRDTRIIIDRIQKVHRKEKILNETVAYFQLDSKGTNRFETPSLFLREFTIVVDNQDNMELRIAEIELFQNQEILITDLKANEEYTLLIDTNLKTPSYDLAQSGIDFKSNFGVVSISQLQEITKEDQLSSPKKFWETSLFMWICIGLATLILGYFCISMIKDMGKEK